MEIDYRKSSDAFHKDIKVSLIEVTLFSMQICYYIGFIKFIL